MRERWQPNGWSTSLSGSRARNCSKMGSMMYGEMAGTGTLLHIGKLREPPDDRVSRVRITSECAASLLAQALSDRRRKATARESRHRADRTTRPRNVPAIVRTGRDLAQYHFIASYPEKRPDSPGEPAGGRFPASRRTRQVQGHHSPVRPERLRRGVGVGVKSPQQQAER